MRVGLVIYGSLETLSGGYLYDRKLVETLRQYGDTVEIFSLPWKNYPAHLLQNLNIRVWRKIAQKQLDVLLQDELNHPSLFVGNRWLSNQGNYPIVSIVHHLRSSEVHPGGLRWFYRLVEKQYFKSIQGCIYNSQTTRNTVQKLLEKDLPGRIVYPGGNTHGPAIKFERLQDRFLQPGPLEMVFVGNLISRKNLLLVLYALADVPNKNWRLRIVGKIDVDPQYTLRVNQFISQAGLGKNVQFCGPLVDEDLIKVWQTSHVLVMPSFYEGFGIVYLEGMSSGVVPVGSTTGAAGEIIQHNHNGFLVDPNDPGELKALLYGLIENRSKLVELSQSAWRRFHDFPSWQATMENARDYLVQVAGTKVNGD